MALCSHPFSLPYSLKMPTDWHIWFSQKTNQIKISDNPDPIGAKAPLTEGGQLSCPCWRCKNLLIMMFICKSRVSMWQQHYSLPLSSLRTTAFQKSAFSLKRKRRERKSSFEILPMMPGFLVSPLRPIPSLLMQGCEWCWFIQIAL